MAEGLLLFYYFPNTSQSASLTAPLKGSLSLCLPLRGKTAKRRQRRKKRAGFEEAARLAGPPGTGNRFAATVWLPAKPTERCQGASSDIASSSDRQASIILTTT